MWCMMFKKKCPVCGAKNSKERITCIECGIPFASREVVGQVARVSTEAEAQVKTEVEKARKEKVADEYWDNEKVLYKTSGKVSLPHKDPQVANLLVTENHVVIVAEEPIKIPLSHIKRCDTAMGSISVSYSTLSQEPLSDTATLTFLDDLKKKRKLPLEMYWKDANLFKQAIYRQLVGKFIDEAVEPSGESDLGELGELFSGIKESFRDHTRDDICAGLRRLGIDAKMTERGRVEEEIHGGGSLGIIYILEGPIRWINVSKGTTHGGGGSQTDYYTEYGVLDTRLEPDSPGPYIRSIRKKTFPVFGKVVDVLWEGEDYGTGVISHLNSDHQLKEPIIKSRDATIQGIGGYGCWIILTETHDVPSVELWNCYQAIARHLLESGEK